MKVMGNVDIGQGGEIINADIDHGTSDPVVSGIGVLYYRTDLQSLRVYDGSTWHTTAYVDSALTPASIAATGTVTGSNLSGTNTGDQTITLTGDVTGSGTSSFATTLATVNGNTGSFGSGSQISTFTVNAKGLITAAGVASVTSLGTQVADINMGSHKITNLNDPTANTDAATKQYADNIASGLDPKQSCRLATTANITLSGEQTIDSVAAVTGDRVLVKNQSTGSENGIYVVDTSSWTRATDFDGTPSNEVTSGAYTFVTEGTSQATTGWVLSTPDPITVGTTALTFVQFTSGSTYTAGTGITLTGNSFSVNQGFTPTWTGAHTFSSSVLMTGSSPALTVNGTGTAPRFQINNTGVRMGYVVGCLSTNDYINGTVPGDVGLAAAAGALVFSVNDGGSFAAKISSAGNVTINTPSSGISLTVDSIDGEAGLVVTSGTVDTRMYAYPTGTTGVVGTVSNHSLQLWTNATSRLAISNAGNVTIAAPASGTSLSISAGTGNYFLTGTDGTSSFSAYTSSGTHMGTTSADGLAFFTNGYTNERLTIGSAGNVTINAPASGNTLAVNVIDGNNNISLSNGVFDASITTYSSRGLQIVTTSTYPISFLTNSTDRMIIGSAGNVTIAAPSSGQSLAITSVGGTTTALSILGVSSGRAAIELVANAGTLGTTGLYIGQLSDDSALILNRSASTLGLGANATVAISMNSTGNVSIAAPSNGSPGLTVTGNSSGQAAFFSSDTSQINTIWTNGTVRGFIQAYTAGSAVLFGALDAGYGLNLYSGGSSRVAIDSSGGVTVSNSIGVGTTASGTTGEIRATNNITAYYSSDARVKTNVEAIPNALDKVNQIRGVTFDWTQEYIDEHGGEDDYFMRRHDVGVIAQEVEAVLPEVIATRSDGMKAVKYDRIVALLIEAIKEQNVTINALQQDVAALRMLNGITS